MNLIWDSYLAYGLNKYRNFDDCDVPLKIDSLHDAIEEASGVLMQLEDINSAVFIVGLDGDMTAVVKEIDYDEGMATIYIHSDGVEMDFFAILDADYDLTCYSVWIEIQEGVYKVIQN